MCIFEFSNISAKYNITYILTLYITYPSYSLIDYVIVQLYTFCCIDYDSMDVIYIYISMNFQFVGLFWDVFTVPVNHP